MYRPNLTKENYIYGNRLATKSIHGSQKWIFSFSILFMLLLLGYVVWAITIRLNVNEVIPSVFESQILFNSDYRAVFEFPLYFSLFALFLFLVAIVLKNRILRAHTYLLGNNRKLYPTHRLQYYVKMIYYMIFCTIAPIFAYAIYMAFDSNLFLYSPTNIYLTVFVIFTFVATGFPGIVFPILALAWEFALVRKFDFVLIAKSIFDMKTNREFRIAKKTLSFKFQLAKTLAMFVRWDSNELMLNKKEKELVLSGALDQA